MTLWRWQRNPELNFPLPIVINGRKYWALDELEAWERSLSSANCVVLGSGDETTIQRPTRELQVPRAPAVASTGGDHKDKRRAARLRRSAASITEQ
jgi:hypothetical protein